MASATIELSVRTRRRWALALAGFAARRGWLGLALWAVERYRIDYRAGCGSWKPLGRIGADRTADGIHLTFVELS